MVKLIRLLNRPLASETDDTRKNYFLTLMLLFSLPISLVSIIISKYAGWKEGVAASILGFILFLISFILLKFKRIKSASILFLLAILLITLLSTYWGGNIKDSSLFMIPIVIIFSGLLLEKTCFTFFSIGSILVTTGTAILSWYHFEKMPLSSDFLFTMIMLIIYFSVTIIAIKVFILYLEQSIKESRINEEKFRNITENLNIGIFTYNDEGKFIYTNNYFYKVMGYLKEDLFQKDYITFIHPDHKQIVIDNAKARLSGKKGPDNYEVKVLFKDGTTHWVVISASKVNLQNQLLGLGSIFDITNKKELEQQILEERDQIEKAKKLESLGLLAGGIAHDFNNLLTGILGNISLISLYLDENDNERIKAKLTDVQHVVKRASDLTNQLLTFSKGGSPVLEIASLETIIRENTGFVLSGSNVKPNIYVEKDLWNVDIDTGQVSQVIQNLVINADQAMPEGGNIEIELRNLALKRDKKVSGTEIPAGEYVNVKIKDNGKGISRDIINKIFDPYFTTKDEGNGLGLATVYSIIEQHKGFISVESIPQKGTVFNLYFHKSQKNNTNREIQKSKLNHQNTVKGKQKKILIMDDETLVLEVAEEIFKTFDFDVDLAENGTEVLKKIKESISSNTRYDIVLLDLIIPGEMGGLETLENILKIDPDIYAIATSGYSSNPVMANYQEHGFKGILKKPYTSDDIEHLLELIIPIEERDTHLS